MNSNQNKITVLRNSLKNGRNVTTEEALEILNSSRDFKVLRKLTKLTEFHKKGEIPLLYGVIVDTETTGLDHNKDAIIELGMVKFEYDPNSGIVTRIVNTFNELEQPPFPIPPESTAVNGITDAMVYGSRIDDTAVEHFVNDANIIIAHNAQFDRQFLEKRLPIFKELAWCCSLNQIPWLLEGLGSVKLDYLAFKFGFFYSAHRAEEDCLALLEILRQPLPKSGELTLKMLLSCSAKRRYKINATGAPFESKNKLKLRGYRWDGNNKVWNTTVIGDDNIKIEVAWLKQEIFNGKSPVLDFEILDALTIFSGRSGKQVSKAI